MSRPKVYVLQEPLRRNAATGDLEPVMDFRKVLEYGDPIICLPSGRVSLAPGPTIDLLREKLKDFDDTSYLVSVGDPTAIFIAAMLVGELNRGKCRCLKWDRDSRQYISVNIDLNFRRNQNADS